MKFISCNSRGFGGGGKFGVSREMIKKKNNVMICGVLEIKATSMNEDIVRRMWRSFDCCWAAVDAISGGGGLL